MNNKKLAIIGIAVFVVVLIIIAALRLVTPEDNWLCVNGEWVKHGQPSSPPPATGCDANVVPNKDEPQAEANIIVAQPKENNSVGLPLIIKGKARVFENVFSYRIKNEDGSLLYENNGYANSPDMGQFGDFEISVNYPEPKSGKGIVEVFEYSAKDGSEINKVITPVIFSKVEAMEIRAYFGNSKKDPNVLDCAKEFAVERRIPKTDAPDRAALEELLKGVNALEGKDGYFTNINSGVKIQKLTIEDGIAKVDFDKTLEEAVGGSCRVTAISAQITETLKQFPTVKKVIISIDGRTEDILQP